MVKDIIPFNLALTLDCGQAFRWNNTEDGAFEGIAFGKYLKIKQDGNNLIFFDTSEEDFENIWFNYFDLGRNYKEIVERSSKDKRIAPMLKDFSGIRILKQAPWEALCSFIISQNNNIPRIKGIISRLCENFGEPLKNGYAFPTPQQLKNLTVEDLAPIRSGFRAKYILEAAKKCSDEINLDELMTMQLNEAKEIKNSVYDAFPKIKEIKSSKELFINMMHER